MQQYRILGSERLREDHGLSKLQSYIVQPQICVFSKLTVLPKTMKERVNDIFQMPVFPVRKIKFYSVWIKM